jgi:hypothetical protein
MIFNIRYLKLICLVGLAIFVNTIKLPEAKAIGITLTQDTPESLDISLGSYPPSPKTSDGVPRLIANGQNWNIFAAKLPFSFAPWMAYFYVQQDRSGSTDELDGALNLSLPTGLFEINGRGLNAGSFTQEISYLASAPPGSIAPAGCQIACFQYDGAYSSVTCLKGSPDCVFYTFTNEAGDPNTIFDNNLRLMADYQPLETSEDVPEPLTIVGSVLALGLGKRFLSKSRIKRQPTKTN